MKLFWTLIIVSSVLVGLGWIAYLIWDWRQNKLEKQMPRQRSERYNQATNSVADYAKKLAEFKKPTYKPEDSPPPDNKQS
jgi:cytoskeletal protein RodZ